MAKSAPSKAKAGARTEPYPSKAKANRAATSTRKTSRRGGKRQTENKELPGFRFLDLPPEIKLQVYGYYAYVDKVVLPEDSGDKERQAAAVEKKVKDFQEVKQTRKSLLLVSRQINAEWTPIFFSTTTILVNPVKRLDSISEVSNKDPTQPRYTPADFYDICKVKADTKWRYVTKLKYIDFPKDGICSFWRRDNGLARLLCVLQTHLANLPSVEKITYQCIMQETWKWTSAPTSCRDGAFNFIDHNGELRRLERQALGKTRKGIMGSWRIQRKLEYQTLNNFWFNCTLSKLVFRREGAASMPRTLEEWIERGRQLGLK